MGLLSEWLPSGTTSIDVILRSNPRAAESTVPLIDAVWSGELVFEDVPVSLEPIENVR